MIIKRILFVLAAFAFTSLLYAQSRGNSAPPPPSPTPSAQTRAENREEGKSKAKVPGMTEKEVIKEIKSAPAETVIKDVKAQGVNFDMTPDIEKRFRKAKATDKVVEAVRNAGPKVRAQMAKIIMGPGEAGTQEIPGEQARAFEALKGELDPDKAIALAEDFAKRYPDSPLLPFVYFFEANGYQQKGDADNVVEATGKGLKLKPDNLACLVMKVGMLPQPQYLEKHAADRDKLLQEAETEGNHALQLIPQVPKQPNEADADFQKRMASTAAQIHGSLGMVHLQLALESLEGPDKAELAKSEQEFKTAVTTTDRPYPGDIFYMGEALRLDGKWDDAIEAYTQAGNAGQGTMIKTYADQRIEDVKKRKALGAAAPKP